MAVLTKALVSLRNSFNVVGPTRDKASDGWIGDYQHSLGTSGHNPDDTPGSRSEYSDADSIAEVRALDVDKDLRSTVTMQMCVRKILDTPADRNRLKYIIWNRTIWTKSSGWVARAYTGSNLHTEHGHFSGDPLHDDADGPWSIEELVGEGDDMFCRYGESGAKVTYMQFRLNNLGFSVGTVDGNYGDATARALAAAVKEHNGRVVDGKNYGPAETIYLDVLWSKKYGGGTVTNVTNGLTLPAQVTFTGTLKTP